jgi:hypothetical protein
MDKDDLTIKDIKTFYRLIRDVLITLDDPENDEIRIDPLTLEELKQLKKEANIKNKDLETYLEEGLIKLGVKEIRPTLGKELSQVLK